MLMSSDFRYITKASDEIVGASGTIYRPINGSRSSGTEASAQTLIRDTYTGKNLFAYCSAFSGTGTTTMQSRIA